MLSAMFILLSSCRHTGKAPDDAQESGVEYVDTTPKATAILWVDKNYHGDKKSTTPVPIRTVKVKADIQATGKVDILSYVKPQSARVERYLQERLEVFRITKVMLDSGFVKPGVQYVQIRYEPGKMR